MKTHMGFSDLFDGLFFSCELGCQKPERAFYQAVQEALALEGQDILFWDDSQRNVQAAREHGWNAEVYAGCDAFQAGVSGYGVVLDQAR